MDDLSPVGFYVRGLEYLREAEDARKAYGVDSRWTLHNAALATAYFAASQSAMMGVMASDTTSDTEPIQGAQERLGNEWGQQLGLLVSGGLTADAAAGEAVRKQQAVRG